MASGAPPIATPSYTAGSSAFASSVTVGGTVVHDSYLAPASFRGDGSYSPMTGFNTCNVMWRSNNYQTLRHYLYLRYECVVQRTLGLLHVHLMTKIRTITIICWQRFMQNMTPPPPVCGNGHRTFRTEIKNPQNPSEFTSRISSNAPSSVMLQTI